MNRQRVYKFDSDFGPVGGLYDLSPVTVDTYINNGDLTPGVLAFAQTDKIVRPFDSGESSNVLVGVATNRFTYEQDKDGKIIIVPNTAIGIIKKGRVIVAVAEGVTASYGSPVYYNADGEITSVAGTSIAGAMFVTNVRNGYAAIELV